MVALHVYPGALPQAAMLNCAFGAERASRTPSWSNLKKTAATFRIAAACFSCVSRELLLLRVVHFLHCLAHVFVRLLHRIEFLLLLRREERPDLGGRAVEQGVHLV